MEYRKVHVKGTYLYDKQFVVLSRGRFDQGNKGDLQTNDGAHVYTPLQVEGINLVIIVNRGWIPVEKIDYENGLGKERKPTRTELTGVVRKSEKPNPWLSNEPEEGIWVYKDVQQMADLCNASPILIDADYESTVPGGPIGGQTNINLRNEHFNYMLQWFGLSFISTMMWLAQIKVKLR